MFIYPSLCCTGYGGRSFLLKADGSKAENKKSDETFKKLKQAFVSRG
jgi:hypothetical protein